MTEFFEGKIRAVPCPMDPVFGQEGTLLHQGLSDSAYGITGTWSFWKSDLLLWLNPRPVPELLPLLYKNYYTKVGTGRPAGWAGTLFEKVYLTLVSPLPYMKERERSERMYLGEGHGRRLLEIGCGGGQRLSLFRQLGWDVLGQEVDEAAAEFARQQSGVDVRTGDLSVLGFEDESFDAIATNHVIEHVLDPVALLEECHRSLRRGGVLVLATPNATSYGHEVYGRDWYALDPPRHLQLFRLEGLIEAARRAGFSKIEGWSSCARAQAIGRGSVDFRSARRRGQHSPEAHIRDPRFSIANMEALWFQWRACWRKRRHPESGEELFLRAVKD